jgi:hypothetical protein
MALVNVYSSLVPRIADGGCNHGSTGHCTHSGGHQQRTTDDGGSDHHSTLVLVPPGEVLPVSRRQPAMTTICHVVVARADLVANLLEGDDLAVRVQVRVRRPVRDRDEVAIRGEQIIILLEILQTTVGCSVLVDERVITVALPHPEHHEPRRVGLAVLSGGLPVPHVHHLYRCVLAAELLEPVLYRSDIAVTLREPNLGGNRRRTVLHTPEEISSL